MPSCVYYTTINRNKPYLKYKILTKKTACHKGLRIISAILNFGTQGNSGGKNPQTGEAIKIAASKAPKFKAGKALKDLVNKK